MVAKKSDRVAKAIEESPYSDSEIGKALDMADSTIWRWRTGKTKRFKESDLKTLANKLQVNYEWLQFGKGSMTNDPDLEEIEQRVADAGVSYKGLDQTVSNVESKARSLIRDLQSLVDDLDRLKK